MSKKFGVVSVLVVALLMLTIPLAIQADGYLDHTGVVNSRPSGSVIGSWDIGGMSFEVDAYTTIEEEHGALQVGACAEVEYEKNNGTNLALKISSVEATGCNTGGGTGTPDPTGTPDSTETPEATETPDPTGTPGSSGDHLQVYGQVDSFPANLVGEWVIDGETYTADANTEFEQAHGAFAVGRCVDVKYVAGSNLILEIETEEGYKCGGGGDTPTAQTYGVLDSFPPELVGTWVVSGTTYTATTATRFEQDDGSFFVGGCVEVKYETNTHSALEIETAEAEKCSDAEGDNGEPVERKAYGLIEAIPANLQDGVWLIGGQSYTATASTELEPEHGNFAVGQCAEVEYYLAGGGNVAIKIATEDGYKCSGGSATNKIYGVVGSLPAGLYGTWVIEGGTYEATSETEFEDEHGDFAAGACVKVKYYTLDGVNHAQKIESQKAEKCGEAPSLPGDSKVYATIDSFPPPTSGTMGAVYLGEWIIGGVTYQANIETKFEEEDGSFAVGACVKAKYVTVAGVNILKEVEAKEAYKCQGDNGSSEFPMFKSYGVVEILPGTPGFTGTWQVSGITYQADGSTKFEQEHGFFAVGAYVEVKYYHQAGTNVALEIETHVASGEGRNTVTGVLTGRGALRASGLQAGDDDWANWIVDGVTYAADPAIEVGRGDQRPTIGELVQLNTYESNGAVYATSVTRGHRLFLPLIFR